MSKIPVLLAGLPKGKMARPLAERLIDSSEFELLPIGLCGPSYNSIEYDFYGKRFCLYNPIDASAIDWSKIPGNTIAVDFTTPGSVNGNVELYVSRGLYSVIGTTGGNGKNIENAIINSKVGSVVGKNMSGMVVPFQKVMDDYSSENEGSMKGCTMNGYESHQASKRDPSGTAKALIVRADGSPGPFLKLGIECSVEQIDRDKIRDLSIQRKIGIKEQYLGAHGWHTYVINGKENKEGLERFAESFEEFLLKIKLSEDIETLHSKNMYFLFQEEPADQYSEFPKIETQ